MSKNVSGLKRIACLLLAVSLVLFVPQSIKAANEETTEVLKQKVKTMGIAGTQGSERKLPTGGGEVKSIEVTEGKPERPMKLRADAYAVPDKKSVFAKGASDRLYETLNDRQKDLYLDFDLMSSSFTLEDYEIYQKDNFWYVNYYEYDDYDDITRAEAIIALQAFKYDHPAYYWISTSIFSNKSRIYLVTEPEYQSFDERKRINKLVEDGAKEYAKLANYGENTLDKIAIIHDRICADVDYAYDNEGNPEAALWAHTIQGVFDSQKKVVCQGYSMAFSLMMNYLKIDNYYIIGIAFGGYHSWNAVYDKDVDEWMYMDLTGDDIGGGSYCYEYFGMPKSDFEANHTKYEPVDNPISGGRLVWLNEIDTSNFNDSLEGTYYYRGGFYCSGNLIDTIMYALMKTLRFEHCISLMSSDGSDLDYINDLFGVPSAPVYYTSYLGTKYYYNSITLSETWNLSDVDVSVPRRNYAYTGSEVKPDILVNGVKLIKGLNINVAYSNNISPGTATCTITGVDGSNFEGETTGTFTIVDPNNPITLDESWVSVLQGEYTYDGKDHKPEINIDGLEENVDYTISDVDTINVGTKTVTIAGKGIYTGSLQKSYTIDPADLPAATLTETGFTYNGSVQRPGVNVQYNGAALTEGTDYDISYSNADSKDVGEYTLTVTGKGNFKGSQSFTYNIVSGGSFQVALSGDTLSYNKKAQRPAVTVTHKDTTLTEGTDYSLTYSNPDSKDVGEYTLTVTGKGNFKGIQSFTYKITPVEITRLTLKKTEFVYDSKKVQKATVSTLYAGNIKLSAKDYTLTYSNKNSKKVGTYKITVTGKGNFTGEITQKYYIKKANPLKVKAKELKIKAKDVKGKSKTFATSKIYNFQNKGKGKLTYAKKSGNDKITVAKNGKVTVGKGLKKGKYTVKINVTAAGNANYASATKTVSVTVRVSG